MKFLKSTSILALVILLAAACTSKPTSDEAEVSEAEEVMASEGTDIIITEDEATMEFVGSKPTGRHYGSIELTEGVVTVKGDEITGGKFVFDLDSITVKDLQDSPEDHQKLVGHLQSVDFFDAANHPNVTFEIVSVTPIETVGEAAGTYNSYSDDMQQPAEGEKIMEVTEDDYKLEGATHEITGNLTMRGNTYAITVPARVNVQDGKVVAFTNFSIDRTKWGLNYGDEADAIDKAQDKFIYNTVGIGFTLEAEAENTEASTM